MNIETKQYISRHFKILNQVLKTTKRLVYLASISNISEVLEEAENRERGIHILTILQNKIEERVSNKSNQLNSTSVKLLEEWKSKCSNIYKEINHLDKQLIDLLIQDKDITREKISKIFSKRSKIGGYNLNNTL